MPTAAEEQVLQCERARREAMMAGDVEALDALLADDAIWVHGSSNIDTKASFLEGLKAGRMQCFRFDQQYTSVRMYGSLALLSGVVDMEVALDGIRRSAKNFYTCAWFGDHGRFRMVLWQSTKMPADPSPQR